MPADFASLNLDAMSDTDFEKFIIRLHQYHTHIPTVYFPKGRDGGIDGMADGTIIQCKHYITSPFSQLKRAAKDEAEKVKKSHPKTYLFATSKLLSINEKKVLQEILTDCADTITIWGKSELEALVLEHPEISKHFPQLWVGKLHDYFQELQNREQYDPYSEEELEQVHDRAQHMVRPPKADEAWSRISSQRILIITGEAGIGKTTLAYWLIDKLLKKDAYTFIALNGYDNDRLNKLTKNLKAIIFYDDFLGDSIPDLRHAEGSLRASFVQRLASISRDQNKYVILVTRSYLLEEALSRFRDSKQEQLKQWELSLAEEDQDKCFKNELLQHKFEEYGLPSGFKKSTLEIILSERMNPRLLDAACHYIGKQKDETEDILSLIRQYTHSAEGLNTLYRQMITRHLSAEQRDLLLILGTFPQNSSEEHVLDCFEQSPYYQQNCTATIDSTLRFLTNYFVKHSKTSQHRFILGFKNGSIRDFMHVYYAENTRHFKALTVCSRYPEQWLEIFNICEQHHIQDPLITRDLCKHVYTYLSHLQLPEEDMLNNDELTVEQLELQDTYSTLFCLLCKLLPHIEKEMRITMRKAAMRFINTYALAFPFPFFDIFVSDCHDLIYFVGPKQLRTSTWENLIESAFITFSTTEVFDFIEEFRDYLLPEWLESPTLCCGADTWVEFYTEYISSTITLALPAERAWAENQEAHYPNGLFGIDFSRLRQHIEQEYQGRPENEREEAMNLMDIDDSEK